MMPTSSKTRIVASKANAAYNGGTQRNKSSAAKIVGIQIVTNMIAQQRPPLRDIGGGFRSWSPSNHLQKLDSASRRDRPHNWPV